MPRRRQQSEPIKIVVGANITVPEKEAILALAYENRQTLSAYLRSLITQDLQANGFSCD